MEDGSKLSSVKVSFDEEGSGALLSSNEGEESGSG